jgi:hypothetical protein
MSFTPENSRLKLTAAEEAKTKEMGHAELLEYLHTLSVDKNLVQRDRFSPDVLLPVEQKQEPVQLVKTFAINGKSYSITGETVDELTAKELDIHRAVLSGNPPEETRVVSRDERGRFTSTAETQEDAAMRAANEAEYRLKMQRGEISVEDYIRETSALDNYLKENFGLDKQAIADKHEIDSWAAATQTFLKKNPEWVGGQSNMEKCAELLEANPQLLESGDKVAALEAVYEYMKQNDLMAKNPDIENHRSIAGLKSYDEIQAAARRVAGIPEQQVNYR